MSPTKAASKAAPSFEDMLGSSETTAKAAKKKKDEAPIIQLPEDKKQAFKNFLKHKENMKNEETLMRTEEEVVLSFCKAKFDEDGLAGNFTNTFKVVSDEQTAKFITVDRFSIGQDLDIINRAKDLLGDKFSEVVDEEKEVVMKGEVFTDEALKKELIAMVGDKFAKFFITQKKFVIKKDFNEKIFKIAGNKDKLAQIREVIVPTKPSLR